MTFSLGHLPGISDSLCSRWSTQLSPETRPFSQAYYLVIHPDTQTRVLPTPQAVIHHVPLFQTTHCYLITILSGEDISTIVLIGLPAANLAHFHFITQLEWSLNNKNQIVPTPHLKQANNFSSFWEKKNPNSLMPDRYSALCGIVWDSYGNCIVAHRPLLPSLASLPSSQVLYLRTFPRKPPACKSLLRV